MCDLKCKGKQPISCCGAFFGMKIIDFFKTSLYLVIDIPDLFDLNFIIFAMAKIRRIGHDRSTIRHPFGLLLLMFLFFLLEIERDTRQKDTAT